MAESSKPRSFLSLSDVTADEMRQIFERAAELKERRASGLRETSLDGKVLGMVFEKASTRTRVSFEVGMYELGGHAVYLAPQGTQIARGEPIEDTARVLGRYCHAIVIRTFAQERVQTLADWANVPVINGLTDLLHPCQLVADLFTVKELRGDLRSVRYAWVGDGNNMAHSWINAAALLGLDLRLACPSGFQPNAELLAQARARIAALGVGAIELVEEPRRAVDGADVVSTDVWASMGQEDEADARAKQFMGYGLDETLLSAAPNDAMVLHCLPAHRGEEISASVLEGQQSVVWRQAENRLHAQKAVLELLIAR